MANPRLLLELVKMLSGGEDTAKKAPPSRIDPESRGPGPDPYFGESGAERSAVITSDAERRQFDQLQEFLDDESLRTPRGLSQDERLATQAKIDRLESEEGLIGDTADAARQVEIAQLKRTLTESEFDPSAWQGSSLNILSGDAPDPFTGTSRKFQNLPETPEGQAAIGAAIRDPSVPTKKVPPKKTREQATAEGLDFEGERQAKQVEDIQSQLIGEGLVGEKARPRAKELVVGPARNNEINDEVQDIFDRFTNLYPQFVDPKKSRQSLANLDTGGESPLTGTELPQRPPKRTNRQEEFPSSILPEDIPDPEIQAIGSTNRELTDAYKWMSGQAEIARDVSKPIEVREEALRKLNVLGDRLTASSNFMEPYGVNMPGRQTQLPSAVGDRSGDFTDPMFGVEHPAGSVQVGPSGVGGLHSRQEPSNLAQTLIGRSSGFDPAQLSGPRPVRTGQSLSQEDMVMEALQQILGDSSPRNVLNDLNVLVQTIEGQISRTGKANPELLRMLTERDPAMARRIRESMDRQAQQARGAPPAKKLTEEEREYIDLERFDDEDFKF